MRPQLMVPTHFDTPFLRMKRVVAIAATVALLVLLLPVFGMMMVASKVCVLTEVRKKVLSPLSLK